MTLGHWFKNLLKISRLFTYTPWNNIEQNFVHKLCSLLLWARFLNAKVSVNISCSAKKCTYSYVSKLLTAGLLRDREVSWLQLTMHTEMFCSLLSSSKVGIAKLFCSNYEHAWATSAIHWVRRRPFQWSYSAHEWVTYSGCGQTFVAESYWVNRSEILILPLQTHWFYNDPIIFAHEKSIGGSSKAVIPFCHFSSDLDGLSGYFIFIQRSENSKVTTTYFLNQLNNNCPFK